MNSTEDNATKFSLKYLALLETSLNISWNEQNEPVCIPDKITYESVKSLHEGLENLLGSTLSEDARKATVSYGKDNIQTVGFGHASDFDTFVKLGFLYGKRVVLWDVISSRLLSREKVDSRLQRLLAQMACNLLLLKPIVDAGGLVILAHPTRWSQLAESVDKQLRLDGNKSSAKLGLSMALSAIEEGLQLHPYTLLTTQAKPSPHESFLEIEGDNYSPENYIFQLATASLIADSRMAYLRDVSAVKFYQIVSKHDSLQRTLRKYFVPNLLGQSKQQVKLEIAALTADLSKLIQKRNDAFLDWKIDGGVATIGVLMASIAPLNTIANLTALACTGLVAPLLTATRRWQNKPEANVLVQSFQEIEITARQDPHSNFVDEIVLRNLQRNDDIDSGTLEHVDAIMAEYWTEQRHEYLMDLEPETAKRVLRALLPEQLEIIVNHRRSQEDYIGDYLEAVWELDEVSFWEHIGQTFESSDGMLMYDGNSVNEVMCSFDMPMKIWLQLLASIQ